jgi:two-component system sensor histidine kinase DctS
LERLGRQVPNSGKHAPQQSEIEYRFRRADGTYADVVDRAFVMYDKEGLAVRVVGSMMDMSERRKAEELARIQLVELAHIARVNTMGEIATGLAHELNQPLTAITNYAESCAHVVATGSIEHQDKLLNWIDKIVANAHRAGEMIRRLRGFTRKSEPRRSTVRVEELIREVLDLLETEFRLHGVRIRVQSDDAALVVVDRIQIQQVLVNLLRNACEAMANVAPDERQVIITAAATADNTVQVSVEDRGEGIRPEHRERIFDAFFTSKRNGVGIGLAISQSIILEHSGRLWVVPNTSRGVTFLFTLPMAGG